VPSVISTELEQFLRERMPSIEQIEIVLMLREDPSRSWTAPEVAGALGTPPESTAMRLFLLASGGILAFEGAGVPRYHYACMDAECATRIEELAGIYSQNRAAFAGIIEGQSRDPIRSFADAFKLKK
jgi:hypothetical protein